MAVYYKFKSARDYDSMSLDGPFISVGTLKEKVIETKHLGRGKDYDLVVTNAQTNEEYLDEASLIPKNTAVLLQRVPGRPRMPIVTEQEYYLNPFKYCVTPKVEYKMDDAPQVQFAGADSSASKYNDETEWDEFGTDLYAIPEVAPVISNNPPPEAPPASKADEDSKIKALIDTPALDWQRQGSDGFGPGRGFGRGMGGRMGGRGFGGMGMGMERKNPPAGYVCHRCKVPGHLIQHCPTNGDPNYDIKRVKPPTGIPKSMLMQTPDGSYALPSGAVAVLRPNEAAFEKEIEGLPSSRPVGDLPPELHCPLCKEVMKDASLTSKCCFNSFCDKCIRDYIISKSRCVCGATSILADDLLPNKTLRDTINRILESGNSSADNAGSTFQVQDMESARYPQPKFPSPTQSAASKGEPPRLPPPAEESTKPNVNPPTVEEKHVPAQQPAVEKPMTSKVPDVSEATHESMSMKEPASQGSAQLMDEEVQQKLAQADAAKKKKKKKVRVMPPNADMWKGPQDLAAENFMMPMGMPPAAFNPYMMGGMQPGMDPFMGPFGGPMPPFMGYGMGPLDMPPFGGMMPPDPFGGQGYMIPPMMPPQRDLAELGMGMNAGPPAMSRDQFEAWKAEMRRRRENDRRAESHREFPREREFGREVSSSSGGANGGGGGPPMKSRNFPPQQSSGDPHHHRQRPERPSPDRSGRDLDRPPSLPSKRKSDHHHDRGSSREARDHKERDYDHHHHHEHRDRDRSRDRDRDHDHHIGHRERSRERSGENDHHHRKRSESSSKSTASDAAAAAAAEAAERKRKASVFSRISFPEGEAAKKKKSSSSSTTVEAASTVGKSSSSAANGYHEKKSASGTTTRKSSSIATADYESSDEDRHFKRKPSRYEPSPPPAAEWEDDVKHSSRSSRDRKHR
ncbi:E3 ubiquitin ligase PQT3-like [Linum perenne]